MRRVTPLLLITVVMISSILRPAIASAASMRTVVPSSPTMLSNGDFEQAGKGWLSPWRFTSSSPAVAAITQDTGTAAGGTASARVSVSRAAVGAGWDVTLIQHGLSLVAGTNYVLTFSAKGSGNQVLGAGVQQDASPWIERAYKTFTLTPTWQVYTLSFVAPATESPVKVQFDLGYSIGKIWIDSIALAPLDSAASTGTTLTATPVSPTATIVPPITTTVLPTAIPASPTVTPAPPSATVPVPTATALVPTTTTPVPTVTAIPPTTAPPPPVIGASLGGSVQDFPRIAGLYSYDSTAQAAAFSRFGMVVAPIAAGTNGSLQALKSQSPATKATVYLDSSAVDVPGFDGMTIYPGWWLTLAGTVLSAPLDAGSTTVHVVNASIINSDLTTSPDVLVDGESMHVKAVDTSSNTLTVVRGYSSTAAPHAAGARIATHASNWSGAWMLNLTPYCPADPATGLTWADYLVLQAQTLLAGAPWDGVFYDNANSNWTSLANGQLDADNDNVSDGGNGPSGTGWLDGETKLFTVTRALLPNAIVQGNGGFYTGASNGQEMEHFPYWVGGWAGGLSTYLQIAGSGTTNTATIINPDTGNTGIQSLQSMRFNLGTALLGNGYYAYDYGTENHGQTWWYDEYDNGAGSSLVASINADQVSLPIAPATGSRFNIGDVIRVPYTSGSHNDEQMLVTSISGDTLTVQRGYNGTIPTEHDQLTKVFTQAQLANGQGWLGQPLSAAVALAPNLWRRDFTHGTALINGGNSAQTVSVGPGYRRIAGTQDPAVNNGGATDVVTLAPQDAILLVKTN